MTAAEATGALPAGYRIARPRLFELHLCRTIEARAATLFRSTRHAGVVGGPVTGMGTLVGAWRRDMVWVAREPRGQPVGFVMASRQDGCFYIAELAVDPGHGRKGLGRSLVARAVSAARQRGFRTVTLSTFADVPWNAPFYRRLGFRDWPLDDLPPDHAAIAWRHRRAGLDMDYRVFMRMEVA